MLTDLIRTALRQIHRNRRRYRGAILATTVGIAGLTTIITVGDSVEKRVGMNLEILGSATIVGARWDTQRKTQWHPGHFTRDDVNALAELPRVFEVAAAAWKHGDKAVYGSIKKHAKLAGVDASFFTMYYLPLDRGRHLTTQDNEQRAQVCVLGDKIAAELFDSSSVVLGKRILIRQIPFTVVGVLKRAEHIEFENAVFIPLTTANTLIPGMRHIGEIYVRAVDWNAVPQLHEAVARTLTERKPQYVETMQFYHYPERIKAIRNIGFFLKVVILGSIGITLLLGGFGIANLMFAVVRERTTEIGLRVAVGATRKTILTQFLCEAIMISLTGAALGILLGFIAIRVFTAYGDVTYEPSVFLFSVLVSVGTAFLLGIAAGLIPARAASKLSALEALRYE